MIRTIAALTLKRLFRGRAVWVSLFIAALPIVFTAAMRAYANQRGSDSLVTEPQAIASVVLVLVVLPAMFVASSIGEDIEDRTTTYLWSRPVPRWNVLAGKLLALAPLCAGLVVGGWTAAIFVGRHAAPSLLSVVAIGAGTVVYCCVAAAIAMLVPRHGMPLMITYMLLFDLPVGAMPISLAECSVSHQLYALTGLDSPTAGSYGVAGGAIGLAVLAVLWLGVALWRIRRLEA